MQYVYINNEMAESGVLTIRLTPFNPRTMEPCRVGPEASEAGPKRSPETPGGEKLITRARRSVLECPGHVDAPSLGIPGPNSVAQLTNFGVSSGSAWPVSSTALQGYTVRGSNLLRTSLSSSKSILD